MTYTDVNTFLGDVCMRKKEEELVVEENTIYEIDLECVECCKKELNKEKEQGA